MEDLKKKFGLRSSRQKSLSNNPLEQLSPTASDRRSSQGSDTNDTRVQTDPVLNAVKRDEKINSYMREKSCRESNAELLAINNPEVEADILNSIEQKYFLMITDSEMAEQLVLEDLPQDLDLNYLTEQKSRLKRQLIVVSKKVSDLILKNELKYRTELERVTKLQSDLSDAIKVCTSGRTLLSRSKQNFTGVSLGIVASYRRREVLKSLLKSLQTIKTLQETDIRLRELLDEDEDYTGAIQLYLECNQVVSTLKHYNCISELNTKLQDTLEMTEEQIDVALSKMCLTFNKEVYLKLMCAYNMLGKTQTAMDQLLMHFASAIHNKAFSIVLGYVELFASATDTSANFHKWQYNELCKCLTAENFVACLTNLCKALWDIMANYYRILAFHKEQASKESETFENTIAVNSDDTNEIDSTFNKTFVIQKLEHGLVRIWQDVQQKVRTIVQTHDLSGYNFDDFIKILGIAEKMVEIGEEFCGSKSEELQNSLHTQTINYFQSYHKSCMNELKEFLDNEIWTICPVHDFSLTHLQEFHFLRTSLPTRRVLSPNSSPSKSQANQIYYFSAHFLSFEDIPNQRTPFDVEEETADEKPHELRRLDSTDSEHKLNSVKVINGQSDDSEPIVTNTTLNVLRLFGKYMQMMSILRPIAFDVMLCMFQLFDYYLFAIYKFFGQEMVQLHQGSLSNEMTATIRRIRDNLIADQTNVETTVVIEKTNTKNKYFSPTLSSMVDMSSAEALFGLAERVVAVESLVVLSNQFNYLRKYLENLIPSEKRPILQQYSNQVLCIACDLRMPAYQWVTVNVVPYDKIVEQMSITNWNIKEIPSLHNQYVDVLLRELQVFSMRLNEVFDKQLNAIRVPTQVYSVLWDYILRLANRTFIEGFSQSKKCSNEGRALMQLDYQQFLTKVEGLTTVRPIPERELVEEYIKAYYLTEAALLDWIKARTSQYNPKQIQGLVNCITNDNKKMRARILTAIDSNT